MNDFFDFLKNSLFLKIENEPTDENPFSTPSIHFNTPEEMAKELEEKLLKDPNFLEELLSNV